MGIRRSDDGDDSGDGRNRDGAEMNSDMGDASIDRNGRSKPPRQPLASGAVGTGTGTGVVIGSIEPKVRDHKRERDDLMQSLMAAPEPRERTTGTLFIRASIELITRIDRYLISERERRRVRLSRNDIVIELLMYVMDQADAEAATKVAESKGADE